MDSIISTDPVTGNTIMTTPLGGGAELSTILASANPADNGSTLLCAGSRMATMPNCFTEREHRLVANSIAAVAAAA